jgi:hypothetical protein
MIPLFQNMRLKLAHHVSMKDLTDRVTTLVLSALSLALALAPIFFLFWLMQPKVLANPGIGALRVAGAASYEPFLDDAEPPQSAEPPRRESAARLTLPDPQYPDISAARVASPRTAAPDIKRAHGFAQYSGGQQRWNGRGRMGLRYLRWRRTAVKHDRTLRGRAVVATRFQ